MKQCTINNNKLKINWLMSWRGQLQFSDKKLRNTTFQSKLTQKMLKTYKEELKIKKSKSKK